jgi:DNA-nicking Smr family endonuclease
MGTQDDDAGWRDFTRRVKPVKSTARSTRKQPQQQSSPSPIPAPQAPAAPKVKPLRRLLAPEPPLKAASVKLSIKLLPESSSPYQPPPAMAKSLRHGKLTPEARLDLHQHSEAQAYDAVQEFLATAQRRNLRLLLIITGRSGILRLALPRWLELDWAKPLVFWHEVAGTRHGGIGARFIMLRRYFKYF